MTLAHSSSKVDLVRSDVLSNRTVMSGEGLNILEISVAHH